MNSILLFGAGEADPLSFYQPFFKKTSIIIALDGGADVLFECCKPPDWVIGDEDSISSNTKNWIRSNNIPIFTFPSEKNESDFELASLKIIKEISPNQIDIFCMQGKRSDHFIFNLAVCEILFDKGFNPILRSCKESIHFVDQNRTLISKGKPGEFVSIYSLSNSVLINQTKGLKYCLLDERLLKDSTRGLSNELVTADFEIKVQEGKAIVFHNRR